MNNAYDSVIIKHIVGMSIVLFIGIVGMVVLSIFIIRWAKRDNWERIMTVFFLALCLTGIVVGIFIARGIPSMVKDVQEDSYITYVGLFETKESNSQDNTELLDGSGIIVHNTRSTHVKLGTHNGKVIYGKHSRICVHVDYFD